MSSPTQPGPDAPPPSVEDSFAIGIDPGRTEAEWYEKVYQGDRMPQLTIRALVMGGIIGMFMSAANLYTTLKIGWSFGVAITAVVISFVTWNLLRTLTGGRLSQMSILENTCMASTASAAGYSTGSTIATGFGALMLIEGHHQPWLVVAIFTLCTAALGVFIAVPMKRQMVNREKLPFPTGIAAATTLRSLYSRGRDALLRAYVLIGGLIAGMFVALLKAPEGAVKALDTFLERAHLRLPDLIPAAGYWQVNGRQLLGFGFDPSLLLIGAGMIVGVRVALSMLAGGILLYFVVGPQLIALDAAHAADPSYLVSIPMIGGGMLYHLPRWALWGGTALMVFASLTAFALQWSTIARAFSFRKKGGATAPAEVDARMKAVEVPVSWMIAGLVPITIAMLLVQYVAFHINLWLGLVAVALSFGLSMVASRATGETDTTPIGAMGKVMQLTFALLSPGNVQHNLISASTAANSASASADLLTDLKSGYLLGANPRRQFQAQFLGIFFGTLAVVPAWFLMVPDKAALERFNPPATNMWKAVADVLTGGGNALEKLPHSAQVAILVGALLGVLLPLVEKLAPRFRPYLPSTMGLGLSWVLQFKDCQAFAIGAVIVWIWTRIHKKSSDSYSIPLASGFIAGESLLAAGIAILGTLIALTS
ncbi:MAG: OPT/YSL family transporter [Opitutaceae bacterium]|nr:OPT/YSL family transporter [Opitutaceae bacterium]